MGKKVNINNKTKIAIINNVDNLSIRQLGKKYSLSKNVIYRILKNSNDEYGNIDYLICKKTHKIIKDVRNNSGIVTKHINNVYDINVKKISLDEYSKYFTIFYNNKNIIKFNKFIDDIRIKYNKKILFNGLTKYYFPTKDKTIFFIETEKIINNDKIKPILFFKLKDRYEQSIFIYEDEWYYSEDIIKNKIKLILEISKLPKIYARKCVIKEIKPKLKNNFLKHNHVQGTTNASMSYGAYYDNLLVAVMTFTNHNNMGKSNTDYDFELNRFATNINYHVIGIGGKLLKHFLIVKNNPTIISFGDRRHVLSAHNNIYRKLGFKLNKISKHDYYYVKDGEIERNHKITMQIKFKKSRDYKLYKEKEYYETNNFKKIWDCGKYRFKFEQ